MDIDWDGQRKVGGKREEGRGRRNERRKWWE